jgi:major type 1 subunit fimbrin (pilin)
MALPTMNVATLSDLGKTSDFVTNSSTQINLTGCPASTNVALTLADTYTLYNATYLGWNNSLTTGAKNVVIQLYDLSNGAPVALQSAVANTKTTSAAGATSWIIAARYYATGVATAGAIQSKADFTITYP